MTATFSISISVLDASGLASTAVTGKAAGADHQGPTLSAVTCLASTTGQVAL